MNGRWSRGSAAMLMVAAACGGQAVIDAGSSSSSSSSTASSSSGGSGCNDHDDCPDGVCIFSTGRCAPACQGDFCASCATGTICDSCATSSCPNCEDCESACVPIQEGQCDSLNPCPADQVCLFELQTCVFSCGPNMDCPNFNLACSPCGTGSCCGCEDCVDVCVPI